MFKKSKIRVIPNFLVKLLAKKIVKIANILDENSSKIDYKEMKAILKHVNALEKEIKCSINDEPNIPVEEVDEEEKKSFEDEVNDRKI